MIVGHRNVGRGTMFFVAAMLLLVMVLTYAILREQHPPVKNPPLHSSALLL
jgi:hypothetical protein